MRRRDFVIALGSVAAVSAPLLGRAQQASKTYRLAIVSPTTPVTEMDSDSNATYVAFFGELHRLGYVEGGNLRIERYSGEGRGHYSKLAAEVIRSNPDAILAWTTALAMAFKEVTTTNVPLDIGIPQPTIPVVAVVSDPIATHLVTSLARPDGNITGVYVDAGIETYGKRLEILHEMVPLASRVAFLAPRVGWEKTIGPPMQAAADQLGIKLLGPPLESPVNSAEVQRVMAVIAQQRTDAIVVGEAGENWRWRQLFVEEAAKYRLPAIYPYRDHVALGGLMAYAINNADIGRQLAVQIDQILEGAKPADVPIYQSRGWKLIINLKTAKTLGIEIPGSILTRADKVIE